MNIKKIGQICKDFRINILGLSLTNFAILHDENLQNIHAFENGRANNIKYIYMYINSVYSDNEKLDLLLECLFKEL